MPSPRDARLTEAHGVESEDHAREAWSRSARSAFAQSVRTLIPDSTDVHPNNFSFVRISPKPSHTRKLTMRVLILVTEVGGLSHWLVTANKPTHRRRVSAPSGVAVAGWLGGATYSRRPFSAESLLSVVCQADCQRVRNPIGLFGSRALTLREAN